LEEAIKVHISEKLRVIRHISFNKSEGTQIDDHMTHFVILIDQRKLFNSDTR